MAKCLQINVQGFVKYYMYGATRSYTGTPVGRQAFVGQLGHTTDDETGLTYMRARYYDNVTGRFVSQDPAQSGKNWYSYCLNDPINSSDYSGLVSFPALANTILKCAAWFAANDPNTPIPAEFAEVFSSAIDAGLIDSPINNVRDLLRAARILTGAAVTEAELAEVGASVATANSGEAVNDATGAINASAALKAGEGLSSLAVRSLTAREMEVFQALYNAGQF